MGSIHPRHSHSSLAETAIGIYQKFCKPGAPHQINLHKNSREPFKIFASETYNASEEELFCVFDLAFNEIMDLLKHDTLMRVQRDAQQQLAKLNSRPESQPEGLSRTHPEV